MYRITDILRGEGVGSDRWIHERTISNTLSNIILDSTLLQYWRIKQLKLGPQLLAFLPYTCKKNLNKILS